MIDKNTSLSQLDAELSAAIVDEQYRQEQHIELIASENYVSQPVLEAQGSILTNKYAEGYPHKRYYGGCEAIDRVEILAIDRAKQLFKANYANVQSHSGSQANAAAMQALLQPGDLVLGMKLSDGGHLTHGSPVSFSGKIYKSIDYGVDIKTGLIDYDKLEEIALEHKPKLIIAGFSAYSQILDWKRFRDIADKIGAFLMADIAHVAGLIAVGLYPSPLPYADVVTSTTHKTLRGPRGGLIIANASEKMAKKLDSAVFPGTQGGPLMHIIAAKAAAFKEALLPSFKDYQLQVLQNATVLAEALKTRGYDIVSGGTKNHLFLIDLTKQGITGKRADHALGCANITVNKNTVPNDPNSPFVTSGIRIGTPAVTTRGFKKLEMLMLADWISQILADLDNEEVIARVKQDVLQLCAKFPVYA